MIIHLVAHLTAREGVDLCEPTLARRLWIFLRRAFPDALMVELMPTHPHLIANVADPDRARLRMSKALAGAVRGHGRYTWEHLPDAEILRGARELRRHIRYVALNPCRAGLAADPIEWAWSTHRDLMGGVVAPWVTRERLAHALHESVEGFEVRLHRYLSSDRSVAPGGTPVPHLLESTGAAVRSLEEIRAATLASTRGFEGDVNRAGYTRDLFVALARNEGWTAHRSIAGMCGVSTQSISRLVPSVAPADLRAARLCLGDHRLLAGPWTQDTSPPPSRRMSESLREFRWAHDGRVPATGRLGRVPPL